MSKERLRSLFSFQNSGFTLPWLILFAILSGFLSQFLGSSAVSPLYAGTQYSLADTDSNYFLFLGESLLSGKKPYIDLYDQKGLYVYLFEALGALLGGRTGVFLLLCVTSSISVFFLLLTAQEIAPNKLGQGTLCLAFIVLCLFERTGNQVGDMIQPFLALSLYVSVSAMNRGDSKRYLIANLIVGVCTAVFLNSRPTEAIWGVAFIAGYLFFHVRHEKGIWLLWNFLACFLAFAFTCLLFFLPAFAGGYAKEMLYANTVQNFAYVGHHGSAERLLNRLATAAIFLVLLLLALLARKRMKKELFVSELFLIGLVGAVQILIARLTSYWISLYPLMLYAGYAALFLPKEEASSKKQKAFRGCRVGFACLSLVAVLGISSTWIGLYYGPEKDPFDHGDGGFITTYRQNRSFEKDLGDYVKSSPTFSTDEVFCFDGPIGAMLYLGKTSQCPYAVYTSWQAQDNPNIEQETLSYLEEHHPAFVLRSAFLYHDIALQSVVKKIESDYTLVKGNENMLIYEENAHLASRA